MAAHIRSCSLNPGHRLLILTSNTAGLAENLTANTQDKLLNTFISNEIVARLKQLRVLNKEGPTLLFHSIQQEYVIDKKLGP